MYNKKNLAVIGMFCTLSIVVIIIGFTNIRNAEKLFKEKEVAAVIKSHFVNVHYFKLKDDAPSIELKSEDLNIVNNTILSFIRPSGIFYSGERKIDYSANNGILNQVRKDLNLSGDVNVQDNKSFYKSDNIIFNSARETISASGNVRTKYIDEKTKDIIQLKSSKLVSKIKENLLLLSGDVEGRLNRSRVYEGKLDFSAQEIELNSPESLMKLSTSVKLHRNNYYLSAQNAEIFLENYNKKLKYYILYDDVKLEEKFLLKSGKTSLRRAYAEKLEAHQKTGKVFLTGAPRVEQGDDIIKGYQITLRENVEMVEVDDSQSSFSLKKDKE